ncbi:MAG: bifunctional 23S rRNA (guanine(2069)-N(7))-methyltransferase RlmK/23S rRNA (guanine(2445)-N(2))-methyltransferase RlmL [Gammaproteobacteria bacterium]|nr:bifunctional 23S rRNA (guanine(2069)-N(7))-methyltransferase RlmK/23S rRNA (guanine(2445)-N(2))-methyltransferase RlmL [Gammaproteobacteria bacterium]
MTSSQLNLFATTPKGLELLLADELRSLGATHAAEKLAGAEFTGDLATAYKACMWSRLANRILLRLARVPANTPEELYAGVQTIQWDEHIDPSKTLAVNFVTSQSKMTHTLFGAQKVKDAIVDQLREKYGVRPNVARAQPDISINVYLYRDLATISLDLSGDSLHKRNYRLEGGAAPLKENLAAAILLRAKWPAIAKEGGSLVDPMCGSGTLLIEGALMAGDIAPGLMRDYFGFLGWKKHQPKIWEKIVKDAKQRHDVGIENIPTIIGYDADSNAIKIAFDNIERAGLRGKVHVEKHELSTFKKLPSMQTGLLIVNPPYGERLGEEDDLRSLYTCLGDKFKQELSGWQAAVFTGNPDLGKQMGIRAKKYYPLFNGVIPCQLLLFDIAPEKFIDRTPATQNERRVEAAKTQLVISDAVQMFSNRIRKNMKKLKRWAEKENISCYRIYDKDLPEYAFAIDIYEQYVYVQEYRAPKVIDKEKVMQRQQEVLAVLPEVLNMPATNLFFHAYSRREKLYENNIPVQFEHFYVVNEQDKKFLVNLSNNKIEIGLPLQERNLRILLQGLSTKSHFLNIFASDGAATVCAAAGGCLSSKTVVECESESSWVRRNLALNAISGSKHEVIISDMFLWLEREKSRYNLIFAELPELENSELVMYQILKLLQTDGILLLTTHDKYFTLDPLAFPDFKIEEITQQMMPEDFTRASKMQRCWKIY